MHPILAFSLNPVTDLTGGLVNGILGAIASAIAAAASAAVRDLGSGLANNTQVTIGARYAALLGTASGLAAWIGVIALLVAAGRMALDRDMARFGRDLIRIILAVMSGALLVAAMPLAEAVIHAMSAAVATSFAGSSSGLASSLQAHLLVAGGGGGLLALVLGVVILIGALIAWAVLIVAQALVYIAAFFIPVAYVLSPRWGRRILDLMLAGLLTPFAITGILAVGLAVIGDGPNAGTVIEHDLMGSALLLLVAFAPVALLHAVRSGGDTVARLRHPISHATSAVQGAQGTARAARGVASAASGGAGAVVGVASSVTRRVTGQARAAGSAANGAATNGSTSDGASRPPPWAPPPPGSTPNPGPPPGGAAPPPRSSPSSPPPGPGPQPGPGTASPPPRAAQSPPRGATP